MQHHHKMIEENRNIGLNQKREGLQDNVEKNGNITKNQQAAKRNKSSKLLRDRNEEAQQIVFLITILDQKSFCKISPKAAIWLYCR